MPPFGGNMIIVDKESYDKELNHLLSTDTWIVDVETNGLNSFGMNQICGIGIALDCECVEDNAYYFPFRHQQGTNLHPKVLADLIKHMNERKNLIGYNIKFDLHFLSQDGLDITDINLIDVLVMVRLTEHSTVKDLDLTSTLKRSYGDKAAQYDIETKKYLRSNKWHKDFSLAPADVLGEYCIKDVEWTRQLFEDRLKKIEESAIIPTRATDSDAGYDLYSTNDGVVPARGRKVVSTGIAIAIPPGYYGRVAPRSGLAVKRGIDVLAGVVDSGYRGVVGVVLQNLSDEDFPFKKGDRVAQLILEQCNTIGWVELEELEDSTRSDGGFGSTGS